VLARLLQTRGSTDIARQRFSASKTRGAGQLPVIVITNHIGQATRELARAEAVAVLFKPLPAMRTWLVLCARPSTAERRTGLREAPL
jgi:hypothetical protein